MDEGAWERLCRAYSRPLFGFVCFCLNLSREQAEEVIQMSFVRCVRSIGTYDPSRGRLFAWLKAIAANEAHTFLRSDRQRSREVAASVLSEDAARSVLEVLDKGPLPDQLLARRELQSLVQEALAELRLRHQEALTMNTWMASLSHRLPGHRARPKRPWSHC